MFLHRPGAPVFPGVRRALSGELGLLSMKLPTATAEKPNRFLVNVERLAKLRKP